MIIYLCLSVLSISNNLSILFKEDLFIFFIILDDEVPLK